MSQWYITLQFIQCHITPFNKLGFNILVYNIKFRIYNLKVYNRRVYNIKPMGLLIPCVYSIISPLGLLILGFNIDPLGL